MKAKDFKVSNNANAGLAWFKFGIFGGMICLFLGVTMFLICLKTACHLEGRARSRTSLEGCLGRPGLFGLKDSRRKEVRRIRRCSSRFLHFEKDLRCLWAVDSQGFEALQPDSEELEIAEELADLLLAKKKYAMAEDRKKNKRKGICRKSWKSLWSFEWNFDQMQWRSFVPNLCSTEVVWSKKILWIRAEC